MALDKPAILHTTISNNIYTNMFTTPANSPKDYGTISPTLSHSFLVVDDFGINYSSQNDLEHLINALKQRYTVSTDMSGSNFVGLDIHWNYKEKYVGISMPNNIPDLLQRLIYTPKTPE